MFERYIIEMQNAKYMEHQSNIYIKPSICLLGSLPQRLINLSGVVAAEMLVALYFWGTSGIEGSDVAVDVRCHEEGRTVFDHLDR